MKERDKNKMELNLLRERLKQINQGTTNLEEGSYPFHLLNERKHGQKGRIQTLKYVLFDYLHLQEDN